MFKVGQTITVPEKYGIIGVYPDYIETTHLSTKKIVTFSTRQGEDGAEISSRYNEVIPVPRTEIARQLINAGDEEFEVCFRKKVNRKELAGQIADYHRNNSYNRMDDSDYLKMADEFLAGQRRILRGTLIEKQPILGRSTVCDKDLPNSDCIREVDHRTLEYLIIGEKKYVLKK